MGVDVSGGRTRVRTVQHWTGKGHQMQGETRSVHAVQQLCLPPP